MGRLNTIKPHKFIIAITIFSFFIRLIFLNTVVTENIQDPYWISKLARGIVEGKYQVEDYELWTTFNINYPPLFPLAELLISYFTNDLFYSGKVISLIFGTLTIPVVYFMWADLESKKVGLLSAWLLATNPIAIAFSVRPYTDSMFLFFSTLSLLAFYRLLKDSRYLIILAIALSMAALTRHEAFPLIFSLIITGIYWKRKGLLEEIETQDGRRNLLLSFSIFLLLTLPWYILRWLKKPNQFFPETINQEVVDFGSVGTKWVTSIVDGVALPILAISLLGLVLTFKKRDTFMPFYLYIVLYSIPHMYHSSVYLRYYLPLMPVIFGWFSISVFQVLSKFSRKYVIISLIVIGSLSLGHGYNEVSREMENVNTYDVIRDSMIWFNSNSEEDARICVGDDRVYEYYTDRDVRGVEWKGLYINLANTGILKGNPIYNLLVNEDIHYYVQFDSLNHHLYRYPESEFKERKFLFEYRRVRRIGKSDGTIQVKTGNYTEKKEIRFIPLKKFQKHNKTVYLYRVDWN